MEETDELNYVLKINEKPVFIKYNLHENMESRIAAPEEIGNPDILFFHDVDGANHKICSVRAIIETIAFAIQNGKPPPFVVADNAPQDIWELFAEKNKTLFETKSCFGHRAPRSLTHVADAKYEIGEGYQNGVVFKPNVEMFQALKQLPPEAYELFLRLVFYHFMHQQNCHESDLNPALREKDEKYMEQLAADAGLFAKLKEFEGLYETTNPAKDLEVFERIARCPQIPTDMLEAILKPALRRLERKILSGKSASPPEHKLDGGNKESMGRVAAVRAAVNEVVHLLADFVGVNIQMRAIKTAVFSRGKRYLDRVADQGTAYLEALGDPLLLLAAKRALWAW